MEDLPKPTDAELEILTVLWSRGPATVRDVHTVIARRKPTQYTTVLKTMQIMAEKGLVRRNQKRQLAGDLLQRGFDGSARTLMMGALSARKASKEELAELRRLLDDYEKGTR